MSREVLAAISRTHDLAAYATDELRSLFNDWLGEIEAMTLEAIAASGSADPDGIAAALNIGRDSAIFVLGKLAREGRITPTGATRRAGKIQPLRRPSKP